jgi:ketosteroid isomerase-like protein
VSQENVESARRGIDAFNRGDVEALAAETTEDVELFAALGGAVEGGGFHGRTGIEAYFQITAETWSEFRILAEDFSDLGDRVLVVGRIWGRGKGSRVPVEAPNAIVMDFRGGKAWRIHSYFDQAEALQDVALEGISRTNVEIVLRWLLAFRTNRDAFSAVTHPEIEWTPFEEAHIPSHGLDGALRLRDRWLRVWDEQGIAIDEIWSRGDDVFVGATVVARSKASGVETAMPFYGHCRVREGKVSYCYEHLDRDQALKAVGLEG